MKTLVKYPERKLKKQKVPKEHKCAYHESGHVVMCYLFHLKFSRVSILDINNSFVYTPGMLEGGYAFEKWGANKTYGLIIIQYFSGVISEAFFCGKYDWDNAQADMKSVDYVLGINNVCYLKVDLWIVAERLVIKNWGLIDYFAKILLEKKELNNKHVNDLLQGISVKSYPPALIS